MKSITQHHASVPAPGPGRPAIHPARRSGLRRRGRTRTVPARAGLIGAAAVAVLFAGALTASAAPAQSPAHSMLHATFTTSAVSVTPNLGMVELLLTGTGTVQGFGAATEVVGVIQDFADSPCGAGGAADSAQRRMVLTGGVLVLQEAGMTCMTASGPQARATYRVDGQASTGIFAGARGTGDVTVDVTTHQETLSGTLILMP